MIFGLALIEAVKLEREAIYPRLLCTYALAQHVEDLKGQGSTPNVIISDDLGRHVINLLAFVSGPDPVQWADLESSIDRNSTELKSKKEWKHLEKWRLMHDALQAMILIVSRP